LMFLFYGRSRYKAGYVVRPSVTFLHFVEMASCIIEWFSPASIPIKQGARPDGH